MKFLRTLYRYGRRFAVTIGIVIAVLVVSTLTIDLGPALKARAERAGGNWLDRKMTIGKLGVHLGSGKFVVEDLRIEGMYPNEPPWLVAKRIDVSLTWDALFHREILLDTIEMTDWKMVVESYPDGRQTFPRLTGPPRQPRKGPPVVVTTMKYVHASRGELKFNDYGSDWFAVAPNLDVVVTKAGEYRGQLRYSIGSIVVQKYEQMAADMTAGFKIVDNKVIFDHIDLVTDGAVSTMTGVVDLKNFPEHMNYNKSKVQFPKQR
jgi:hypothetical protein